MPEGHWEVTRVTGESLRVTGGSLGVTKGHGGITGGPLGNHWGSIGKKLTKCHLKIPKKSKMYKPENYGISCLKIQDSPRRQWRYENFFAPSLGKVWTCHINGIFQTFAGNVDSLHHFLGNSLRILI